MNPEVLYKYATIESHFLEPYGNLVIPAVSPIFIDRQEDEISREIMQNGGIEGYTALQSTGNGNCLFNSVSILLFGNESKAVELRVRTALEMICSSQVYSKMSDLLIVSPSYLDATVDCAKKESWSCAWTMQALATVIDMPIVSMYPRLNGSADKVADILNRQFLPLHGGVDSSSSEHNAVYILWSHTSLCQTTRKRKIWTPNHFVPLIKSHFSPVMASTPNSRSVNDPDLTSPIKKQITQKSISSYSDSSFAITQSSDEIKTNELDEKNWNAHFDSSTVPAGGTPNNGKLLSNEEVYVIVLTTNMEDTIADIPRGNKSNLRFVVNNSQNVMHTSTSKKTRSTFFDDCGIWNSYRSRTVRTTFLVEGKMHLRTVSKRDGVYCYERRIHGKKDWVELEQQPTPSDVIVMCRYYSSLKHDACFSKRISWIEFNDKTFKGNFIAVHEYIGTFPTIPSIHGKNTAGDNYYRAKPCVMQKITRDTRKPRDIYEELLDSEGVDAPQSTKQIRNARYRHYLRCNKDKHLSANVADEVLAVVSMVSRDDYVQNVMITKKGVMIVLYCDEQIMDLKSALKCQSMLAIDKTYNLGKWFVSCFTYKSVKVEVKETRENPIMVGPIMLHDDSSFETYHNFFSIVKCVIGSDQNIDELGMIVGEDLILGSDDEKAISKALDIVFPNASRYLCTKHLRENIIKYLTDKIGVSKTDRSTFLTVLFGSDGLTNSDSSFSFETRAEELLSSDLMGRYPTLKKYFVSRLQPIMWNHVVKPQLRKSRKYQMWTNNNCESINSVFKADFDWKPVVMHEMVSKLYRVVKRRLIDLRRATYGTGNYRMLPTFHKRFLVSVERYNMYSYLYLLKFTMANNCIHFIYPFTGG